MGMCYEMAHKKNQLIDFLETSQIYMSWYTTWLKHKEFYYCNFYAKRFSRSP